MRRLPAERMGMLIKVARMYHEQSMRQPEIASRLHISQSRVSRLLKEASELGIVRTVVLAPPGVQGELEDEVRDAYGLTDVVIVDTGGATDTSLLATLGSAGASYLEVVLTGSDRIGISSWSSTLLATVDAMQPRAMRAAVEVVQMIGGVGNATVQVQATHLADRLARVTGARAKYLPAPGIVASRGVRDALLQDPNIQEVAELWDKLTIGLVGIGSLEPSPLLRSSGNAISEDEQDRLRAVGAVGDVCLQFFDASGNPVQTDLRDRVVGVQARQLRSISRIIGIAGGSQKFAAIRAALLGSWIHVLVTDVDTGRRLVEAALESGSRRS